MNALNLQYLLRVKNKFHNEVDLHRQFYRRGTCSTKKSITITYAKEEQQRSRSPSPIQNTENEQTESPISINNPEQIPQRSRSPSIEGSEPPLATNSHDQEQSQSPTHFGDQTEENNEVEKSERSPSLVPSQENPEQATTTELDLNAKDNSLSTESETQLHSDTIENVSENPISSPELESQPLTSSTPITETKDTESDNNSIPSTQRSSLDRSHTLDSSLPSTSHHSNIQRSKSKSTVARPNTLPFTPNNHDLDGLYTSNDYDDEEQLLEDSEYHRNSAPSTVSIERRRSSLLDSNAEHQQTPIDPNDIIKRLSIVENSTTDGILLRSWCLEYYYYYYYLVSTPCSPFFICFYYFNFMGTLKYFFI